MAKPDNTNLRDAFPSLYHRRLGRKLYMLDIDHMAYTYRNGNIEFCSVIDWKNGSAKNISTKWSPIQAQIVLADKLEIPFFIVVTYLDPALYKIPMYYVIPINTKAKSISGMKWYTEYDYSLLEHQIRNASVEITEALSKDYTEYDLPEIEI